MSSPKMLRIQLGRELRELREAAGIESHHEAAKPLGCDITKISRIESGQATVSPLELDLLLNLYKVKQRNRERLVDLADGARKRGNYGKAPTWTKDCVGVFPEAEALKLYYGELIPALLQIPAYAHAVISSSAIVPERDVDRLVGNRAHQRAILTREHPPETEIVLGEAVLWREVGGTGILREQLKYIREVAQLEHISLHILPFSVGAHPALETAFTLLYLTSSGLRYVYLEDLTGGGLRRSDHHVDSYEMTFDRLLSTALNKRETLSLLDRVISDLD